MKQLFIILPLAIFFVACANNAEKAPASIQQNVLSENEVHQTQLDIATILSGGDTAKFTPYQKEIYQKVFVTLYGHIKKVKDEKHIYLDMTKEQCIELGLDGAFYDTAVKDLNDINNYLDTASVSTPDLWEEVCKTFKINEQ